MAAREPVISVRMHFKYDGGLSSAGQLEIYDAAVALRGISRALALTTHAFVNAEVRSRGERAVGAKIIVHPPTRGSYDQLATVLLDPNNLPATLAVGAAGNALWDFIKVTWSAAVGALAEAETPAGRRMQDRIEPVMGELADVLEPAVRDMHRPIQSDDATTMQLIRPRVGTILTLDEETLAYVTAVIEADNRVLVSGNVTRYNILSGYGRFYDDTEERTVPFKIDPAEVPRLQREMLTWSLDQTNRGNEAKLLFDAVPVRNVRDETLRYIVHGIRKMRP